MISELQKDTWLKLTGLQARLPHALLFHGAPGVGKLALAERLAQLLLCEKRGQGSEPCGRCEACRWFVAGNHPDLRIVEPEVMARSHEGDEPVESESPREKKKPSLQIRIEQTRALGDFVNLASHRGGVRIAILHPVEDMNTATANSLLKSLEEPPAGAMFLLVSHRPARLLPTIRSRCVPVPVPLPASSAASTWLSAQGVKEPARWLAFAGGAPMRALEYATGERGEAIMRAIRTVAAGRAGADAVRDRDELEPLAEVLQKIALDRAFEGLTGSGKYTQAGTGADRAGAKAWLAYARRMGRERLLARHPLNPKLYAADLIAGMPGR